MSPRVVKPGAIGQRFSRVDGRLKTTGKATFAAEYKVDDVTHGALVFSRIARGKIKHIDTRAAATAPGVISVLTHENAPAMKPTAVFGEESEQPGAASASMPYLNTDEIYFYGQPIAVIVAETLEQAEYAATLVTVDFPIGGFSPPEGRLARGFKPPAFSRFLFQSAVKSAESFLTHQLSAGGRLVPVATWPVDTVWVPDEL